MSHFTLNCSQRCWRRAFPGFDYFSGADPDASAQQAWDGGLDKPFLFKLLSEIKAGAYGGLGTGVLNVDKLIPAGYSVGAQMVSWLIQVHASGQMKPYGEVVAGVMFAGGSYNCYNQGSQATGHCSSCSIEGGCDPDLPTPPSVLGCSNTMLKQTGKQPCCDLCCPENVTEDYFTANRSAYKTHPPTFLVQNTAIDENADTCAARNYHQAMVQNGAVSELALIPFEFERCSCVGQPGDDTSAGSPFRQHCHDFPDICVKDNRTAASSYTCHFPKAHEDVRSVQRCEMHTMGFSGMVSPLVRFLMNVTAGTNPQNPDYIH